MTREKKLETGLSRLFSNPKKSDVPKETPPQEEKKSQEAEINSITPKNSPVKPKKEKKNALPVDKTSTSPSTRKPKQPKPSQPTPVESITESKEEAHPGMQAKQPVIETQQSITQAKLEPSIAPEPSVEEQLADAKALSLASADTHLATYETNEHLVIFSLANQQFGVNIKLIESIIKMQQITEVPGAPHTVEGITNLRGKVLPVIDIHMHLGLPERVISKDSRIIVTMLEDISAGLVVDEVNAVQVVEASEIEPPSPVVTTVDVAYVKGIAKIGDKLVIVLDLEKLLMKMDTRGYG